MYRIGFAHGKDSNTIIVIEHPPTTHTPGKRKEEPADVQNHRMRVRTAHLQTKCVGTKGESW
jgi:hypothetical protein